MYGYWEQEHYLSIDDILLRVTQEDIFSWLLGEAPDISKKYLSLVRSDNSASCFFTYYSGKLYFVDFGNAPTHMDCFGVISILYNCDFQQSLRIVNDKFSLGLGGEGIPVKIKHELPKTTPVLKHHTDIIYKIRPFDIRDKEYWTQFGISRDNLMEDSVVPVLWYKFFSHRMGKDVVVRPINTAYAFSEFSPRVKIYSPNSPKSNGKWISNVGKDDVGNMDKLPISGEKLVITKSYKDCRVLRNHGVVSCWFQNEGAIPNDSIISRLSNRFDNVIVLFDNDETGKRVSQDVVSYINSRYPGKASFEMFPEIENIKDASDFYLLKGKLELVRFLVTYNLI